MIAKRKALIGYKVGNGTLGRSMCTLLQGNRKMKVKKRWIMGRGGGGR